MTRGDFYDGSEKGTANVHQILCQPWKKCYGNPLNDSTRLRGPKRESYTGCFNGIPGSRQVAHQLTTTDTQGDPQVVQLLKLLHEFKSSSVRIDVGPFATLLRTWKLVMGHASRF